MSEEDTNKIIQVILMLVLPPLAVWFHDRNCTGHVCINLCLCFFGFLPGIIHALWYCFMRK